MPKEIVPMQMQPPGEPLVMKLFVVDDTTDGQILQGLIGLVHIAQNIDYFAPEDDEPIIIHAVIGDVTILVNRDSDASRRFLAYTKARQLPCEVVIGLVETVIGLD
jgi:hypothetical protein